jgi:predicted nucleotide-binding protein
MFFNEMQLKVYYEMKKEEMEKAMSASKYSKSNQKENLFKVFFNAIKNIKTQKKNLNAKQNCCDIKIQQVCCQN